MQKENLYNQIEQYLRGEMDESSKTDFDKQLENHEEVANEFDLHSMIHEELENREKQALRTKLHDLGDEFFATIPDPPEKSKGGNNVFKILIGILLILGLVSMWFLIGEQEPLSDTQTTPQEEVISTEENIEPETSPIIEESIPERKEQSELNKQPQSNQKNTQEEPRDQKNTSPEKPAKKEESQPKSRPIAGNFEVNPAIEKYFTGTLSRGADYEVSVSKPEKTSELLLKEGKIQFTCSGEVTSDSGEAPFEFKIRLFTNKPEDFRKNAPLKEWDIEFEESEGSFKFEVSESIALEPGLYYFIIEDWETGERYFYGKTTVK